MLQKKGEFILEFIKSLDKEHEYNFSPNLLLLCYYSFNITLLPKDIMRMASTFEFTNRNYIKKNPAIFEQCLSEIINNKYGPEGLHINRFITKTELSRIKMDNMRLFANMSLLDKEIPVPMLSENFRLKKEINALLIEAHEKTKKLLAAMRKKAPIGPKDQSSEIDKVVYTQRYIPDDSDEAKQIRTRQEAWKKMTPAERSKQAGTETKERMESTGLTMYVWETSGDERVCPACRVMDGKLCLWADPMVYSRNKGKDWILRPKTAVKVHPGENICKREGHCRCTAISYYPELVGEL
jgi:hypothetical protein